jgi:hypothetical protein
MRLPLDVSALYPVLSGGIPPYRESFNRLNGVG